MGKLIKEDIARTKKFHGTFRVIDERCTFNDGREFQESYEVIYSKELVLKLEYSRSHATFLDLDISIGNGKISSKLYFLHAKLS